MAMPDFRKSWLERDLFSRYFLDIDELAAIATFGEGNGAADKSIEGMVFAYADVLAGVVLCAALALEDVAGLSELAAENFYTESFAF